MNAGQALFGFTAHRMANQIKFRIKLNNIETITRPMRQEIAIAVEETGAAIVDTAQSTVAVRTGFLRDSIGLKIERKGNAAFGRITAIIQVTAIYAKFVEFGTRKMAAQPFLYPAVQMHIQEFLTKLRRILGR